ncbi:MAG TPA: LTA synthase family protein [Thermoanaerobaculia bacterium]|jgi:phosphoglycerol transferase MdoB-like AlkP superfamily enzyme|nr:LTA synthase family protein [Thermoanaerobaculia bacterium]
MPAPNLLKQARSLLLGSRYRVALIFISFYMTVWLLTRLGLLIVQNTVSQDGVLPVLEALGVGELFDGVAALWLALPLVIYLAVVPERWFRRRLQKVFLCGALGIAAFTALFVALIEYYFFQEFNGRFNFVAVDYLVYPTEVVDNIWQSYHTGLILTFVGLATVGLIALLSRRMRSVWEQATPAAPRLVFVLVFVALLAGTTEAVSPALAHVSEDRALNEIAENGYYTFWLALLGSDAPYEGLYATRPQAAVLRRLHGLLAEPAAEPGSFAPDSTLRHVANPGPQRRMNVVVVLEESLGSEFIGALHPGQESLTPQFDALTREGTLLTHAYSTGNRTIRAIEATTSSLPPLPGESIVRRDRSVDLFTLPELLRGRGYQTMFVYGGRALFDGMGKYLSHNGVDRIVDQRDFPDGTFTTAWGACDEAIFDKALTEMDRLHATGRPFYSLVLSVSNHRPFTFPQDHLRADPRYHRRENAVRYADYALGRFMRQAKGHAFYGNTLFVLMGDHGARVYGAAAIPLASYEVPILFIAPGAVPAGARIATLASSLDVPPSVLGRMGMEYDSKFFGHDIFRTPPSGGRALMTHNNEIALLRGSRMAVLGLHESVGVYEVDPATEGMTRFETMDAESRELIEDAIAYFNGADRLYRSGAYAFTPGRRGGSDRLARRPPSEQPAG